MLRSESTTYKPYSDGTIMKQAVAIFAEKCSISVQIKAKTLQHSNNAITQGFPNRVHVPLGVHL